jgi:EAL domain-containing protein (putative c-di-GMP-specific phosphodiesterase class I)
MAVNHIQNGTSAPLSSDLDAAFERDEIDVHFQPKVDLRSTRVVGIEALARWDHPSLGLLPAERFIDLVESNGQMRALTERVVKLATRATGDWWRSGLGLQLSVNLAPSTFFEPDWSLDRFVEGALAEAGLPGKAIRFEVTEDALVAGANPAAEALTRLSRLGAMVSVDDFGTGHFSFSQLMNLPIDELKIDRSLVAEVAEDRARTIVRSAIHVAHQMGIHVVAEGIESKEVWHQLRSMGCERAQGFLIARPLSARQVPAWLVSWNQKARELSPTRPHRRRRIDRRRTVTPAEATA